MVGNKVWVVFISAYLHIFCYLHCVYTECSLLLQISVKNPTHSSTTGESIPQLVSSSKAQSHILKEITFVSKQAQTLVFLHERGKRDLT